MALSHVDPAVGQRKCPRRATRRYGMSGEGPGIWRKCRPLLAPIEQKALDRIDARHDAAIDLLRQSLATEPPPEATAKVSSAR